MTGPSGAGGRVVGRRYRLIERVGQGGMGTVWQAHDDVLNRMVAVKEVDLPQLGEADRADLRERTMREARAAARMSHPNAVTVYDVIEEDGRPWIIMALVPAESLAQVIRDSGPLEPHRVAQIGLDVLSALQAAHAAGILHRDVKPGNVLLGHDGRTVLTDFGIATLEGDSSLTSTGLLMGAPAYIAPERARGLRPGPASDLWSLGATLYAAVEGRPPYDRDTPMATLTALISEEAPVPRNAGPLTPVLTGLLKRDPAERLDAPAARRLLHGALAVPEATRTLPTPVPVAEPATGSRERGAWTQVVRRPPRADEPPPFAVAPRMPVRLEPLGPTRVGPGGRGPAGRSAAVIGLILLAAAAAAIIGVLLGRGHQKPVVTHSPTPVKSSPSAKSAPSAKPSRAASPTAKPSPQPSPSAVPTPSTAPSARPSPSPLPSASIAPTPSGGGSTPAGFARYTDPTTGSSVAAPAGWYRTRDLGSQYDLQDPRSGRFLRFGHTSQPPTDPVADWQRQEQIDRPRFPGYQRLSISSVAYRGYPAADWNFTFGSASSRTEVLNRGFETDSHHGYAIYLSAPQSQWAASLPIFETAAATFRPS